MDICYIDINDLIQNCLWKSHKVTLDNFEKKKIYNNLEDKWNTL